MSTAKMKWLIPFAGFLLFASNVQALMPPKEIAERNLNARLILVGEVLETGKILLPDEGKTKMKPKGLFVIKVFHVIKGYGTVKPDELVRIAFRLPPKVQVGIFGQIAGNPPVKIKDGDFVLVYINPSEDPNFLL